MTTTVTQVLSPRRGTLSLLSLLLVAAIAQLSGAQSGPEAAAVFENEIKGKPEIECLHDQIKFIVDTLKGSPAAIYVRGNSGNEECVFKDVTNASIPLNKCNMRRKREINPIGVSYSFTVVVQHHPLFLTKVDRAYNVHCFYMEAQKDLSAELGVSDMTTQLISNSPALPSCNYTVHRDSQNGPIARYANVGDPLFHVWQCPSDLYVMLLHSCEATNNAGSRYTVIDSRGCSVDTFIMPEISYDSKLTTAIAASFAFNFPDKSTMLFNCQIRLCFRGEDCSALTPPRCGAAAAAAANLPTSGVEKQAFEGNQNSLTEELDKEQLIPSSSTSTNPTSSTSATSTVPLTSSTVSSTASTGSSTASTGSSTTTTTTQRTSTNALPSDFPTPSAFADSFEGSGEDWTTQETPTSAALKLLKKIPAEATPRVPVSATRNQRHSPPKPRSVVNFDIQSPELTIMDNYLERPAPSMEAKQLYAELPSNSPVLPDRVCVPTLAFYGAIGLVLFFTIVIFFALIKSRHSLVHKFY